jgi:hypothetical protein
MLGTILTKNSKKGLLPLSTTLGGGGQHVPGWGRGQHGWRATLISCHLICKYYISCHFICKYYNFYQDLLELVSVPARIK